MKPETKSRRDRDRAIWLEASRKAGKYAQLLALERVRTVRPGKCWRP